MFIEYKFPSFIKIGMHLSRYLAVKCCIIFIFTQGSID